LVPISNINTLFNDLKSALVISRAVISRAALGLSADIAIISKVDLGVHAHVRLPRMILSE